MDDIPEHLVDISRKAIASAKNGKPWPAGIEKLYEWLETSSGPDDCFFGVEISNRQLTDDDLRDWEEDSSKNITDADRIRFARETICRELSKGPSDERLIAYYTICDRGNCAILGAVIKSLGQGGDDFIWYGPYLSVEEFCAGLKECGWIFEEKDITPEHEKEMLQNWGRD